MNDFGPVMVVDESAENFLQLTNRLSGAAPLWAPTTAVVRWWMRFLDKPVSAVMVRIDQVDDAAEARLLEVRREANSMVVALMNTQPSSAELARLERIGAGLLLEPVAPISLNEVPAEWRQLGAPSLA